jgi:dTDP-glucose 4,6-dehydratase
MKNILVTGGCGFIGSNFINWMLDRYSDIQIYNIDCLNPCASIFNVRFRSSHAFIKGNIADYDFIATVLRQHQIDTIVHFAAQSHVDTSFDSSLQYTQDNVVGTHTLLQASKEYGKLEKFIHFSTDEVYGEVDRDHPGCSEISLLNPTNPYAATKAAAEFLVRSYQHSFGFPSIIVRCNNVYGPNQYPEKLIPKFIQLLRENKPLTIHGDGSTRRNFIWVEDVSVAVDLLLRKGTLHEIYNIGTDNEFSVLEIAKMLSDVMNREAKYQFVPDRPFNDRRYAIDSTKLRSLGWKEQPISFVERLKTLI